MGTIGNLSFHNNFQTMMTLWYNTSVLQHISCDKMELYVLFVLSDNCTLCKSLGTRHMVPSFKWSGVWSEFISRTHHSFHMGTDTFHMKCENLTAFRKLSHCFSAFEEGGTQETHHQLHNMPVPKACCHILWRHSYITNSHTMDNNPLAIGHISQL